MDIIIIPHLIRYSQVTPHTRYRIKNVGGFEKTRIFYSWKRYTSLAMP